MQVIKCERLKQAISLRGIVCNTHTSGYSDACDESWHWKEYMHNLNAE